MTKNLLSNTNLLMNHVYWFEQDFKIQPRKDHRGAAINFTDIKERKDDFLNELIHTISSWVYSQSKSKKIVDERLMATNGDLGNAASFLTRQSYSKFRPGHPQGQFGELLLFNFIQHFHNAVPLLRKQRITTSKGHERFGADAIHYCKDGISNVLILGESKCYQSDYMFKTAFETSLTSILNTFESIDRELDLYVCDDFIEPELEFIAKEYKRGTLKNVRFELVCLIAYNETKVRSGQTEDEIKNSIKEIIKNRCAKLDHICFSSIEASVLSRMNYIIFPIWNLESLLAAFQKTVGSTHET